MLSTGIVLYYVRDNSKETHDAIKDEIESFISKKMLIPENITSGLYLDNFVKNLPIGTILCAKLSKKPENKVHVCFPLLSTHVSLPLKKGEFVWFYNHLENIFSNEVVNLHPMLSVKSFWLSRKVGSSLSEDLAFSFLPRDIEISNESNKKEKKASNIEESNTRQKKLKKEIKKEEEKIIRLPDYKFPETFIKNFSIISEANTLDIYESSKSSVDFLPAAVPRWHSKPYELSLQGSNNSLINLTKTFSNNKEIVSSGAIDLVVGRKLLENYKETKEDDFYIIKNKHVQNDSNKKTREIKELKINKSNSVVTVLNLNGDKEIIKGQSTYFGEDFHNNNLEGTLDIKNDASRIYITEFDSLDTSSFYNSSLITLTKLIDFNSSQINLSQRKKEYLPDALEGKNYNTMTIQNDTQPVPSVLFKTNDIRIIARKSIKNKEKELKEGSIRLIKESNLEYNRSHILLEKDGTIAIDGSVIYLGNFKKEVTRQKINVSNNDSLLDMNGNGYGVVIGYDENLSEPLVLGNSLHGMLKELININIQLTEDIKSLSVALSTHVHLGCIAGVSGAPQIPKPFTDFSGTKQPELKNRYKDIQKNLKEMLSRFAKTS